MSSSRSKITTVACTKCKQDFSFERVPKMASVTCPHCNTKIRLTRKPKEPSSPQPSASDLETPNDTEEANDFPEIKTRRTRKRINLNGLQFDSSDTTNSEIDETDEASLEIKTRRTRKRVNLNNLRLDETDPPESVQPQPPVRRVNVPPPEAEPPSNNQNTSDTPIILPAGRRLRGNSPPKPKSPTPKPKSPTPKATEPQSKTVETPSGESLIAPSGRRTRSKLDSTEEQTQPQTADPPATQYTSASTTDSAPPFSTPPVASQLDEPKDDSLERPETDTETIVTGIDQSEREDENSLLPPKFLVADIEANENAVVLPSATDGTQVVSRTEVTVSHGGQTVKLVTSSPEELRRIRLIENLVAVVIAGIMLAIAVWVLL